MRTVATYLGRILALLAVLASAMNAQCTLTCSIESPPVVTVLHEAHASHACCPGKKTAGTGHEKRSKPCSDSLLMSSSSGLISDAQASPLTGYLGVAPTLTAFVLVCQSAHSPAAFGRPIFFSPPVLSSLRI